MESKTENKIFYISDMHFGHKNIVRYDNRPFYSTQEMDDALINNWNSVVSDNDTVYILGDFSWYKQAKAVDILNMLKGNKVLIKGNHDKSIGDYRNKKFRVADYLEIHDGERKVILSHYPMPFWNGQHANSIHLYGHVHDTAEWNILESWKKEIEQLYLLPYQMYNVGVMMPYMKYTPKTLDEIIAGYYKLYNSLEIKTEEQ